MQSDFRKIPPAETTIQLIRLFFDATNRHDVDAIMAAMTEDCVFENTYPPPDGDRFEGQAAVRAFWETLFNSSQKAVFEVEEIFACGERCCVRWLYHWIDFKEKAGHIRGVDIFQLKGGKIAEKYSYVKG